MSLKMKDEIKLSQDIILGAINSLSENLSDNNSNIEAETTEETENAIYVQC